MKTSVEKLYFDWTDPNTGESPKSYPIRVYAPGSDRSGDLMSHRVIKLLQEHGSEVLNFPKTLLTEIYDDCCWGFAGYLFTGGLLAHLQEESYAACPRNYTHMTSDEWIKLSDSVIECMRLRVIADTSKYFEIVTATSMPDDFREAVNRIELIVEANEEYAAAGDWILSLEDQSLMPELTLVLLGLRRGFWSAFHHNCSKFEPLEDDPEDELEDVG